MSREIDLFPENSPIFYVLLDVTRNNGNFYARKITLPP